MKKIKAITGLKIEDRVLYDDQDYLEYYTFNGLQPVVVSDGMKLCDRKFDVKVAEIQHFHFAHQPDLFLAVYDEVDEFLLRPFHVLRSQEKLLKQRVAVLEINLATEQAERRRFQSIWTDAAERASRLEKNLISYQETTIWQRIKFVFGVRPND